MRKTTSLGALALLTCTNCISTDEPVGTAEAALSDWFALPDVPGVTSPSGYGTYCSVTDPTNGGWAFTYSYAGGDPCAWLAPQVGPHAMVMRAGLWAENGNNQVM